ncbi:ROK family glucokinase [Pengzhenrongella phosphoraccumulans]|uniref:ROK family glucokinase n=1 Tax=Pengzhenrongella phosphoraccumulans TaxID=3114394 RepID=UPI00388DFC2A
MHAIGVDIGGTKIAAGVVDEDGNILAQTRRVTDPHDAGSIDRAVCDVYDELSQKYEVGAIGVAAAGFVNSDRSTVLFAPNIAWRDYPLQRNVAALLSKDVRIVVENDANAAGWAEFRFGAGRDVQDMLLLTVGTGLGGAVVVGGNLVRGAWGVAAEVGHMRVVPNGHLCGCGNEGCWEQYASGSALVRDAQAAIITQPARAVRLLELAGGDGSRLEGPHVTLAAQEGDPLAIELLAELGRWIGEGSATAAAILDPALVVIGGGVGAAGELLLDPARHAFENSLSARGFRPLAAFTLAAMGNEAGIVGAADLARI